MLQALACNFIKKEILAQVFSCEFCEIFKNTFLTERRVAASSKNISYWKATVKKFFQHELRKLTHFWQFNGQ